MDMDIDDTDVDIKTENLSPTQSVVPLQSIEDIPVNDDDKESPSIQAAIASTHSLENMEIDENYPMTPSEHIVTEAENNIKPIISQNSSPYNSNDVGDAEMGEFSSIILKMTPNDSKDPQNAHETDIKSEHGSPLGDESSFSTVVESDSQSDIQNTSVLSTTCENNSPRISPTMVQSDQSTAESTSPAAAAVENNSPLLKVEQTSPTTSDSSNIEQTSPTSIHNTSKFTTVQPTSPSWIQNNSPTNVSHISPTTATAIETSTPLNVQHISPTIPLNVQHISPTPTQTNSPLNIQYISPTPTQTNSPLNVRESSPISIQTNSTSPQTTQPISPTAAQVNQSPENVQQISPTFTLTNLPSNVQQTSPVTPLNLPSNEQHFSLSTTTTTTENSSLLSDIKQSSRSISPTNVHQTLLTTRSDSPSPIQHSSPINVENDALVIKSEFESTNLSGASDTTDTSTIISSQTSSPMTTPTTSTIPVTNVVVVEKEVLVPDGKNVFDSFSPAAEVKQECEPSASTSTVGYSQSSSTTVVGTPASSNGTVKSGTTSTTYQPVSANNDKILTVKRLDELISEVDKEEIIDDDVKEVIIEYIEDFVNDAVENACIFAKHRNSNAVEVKDVQLYLEKVHNMWLPGFGTEELKAYKRAPTTEAHKQRLALIKKSIKKY